MQNLLLLKEKSKTVAVLMLLRSVATVATVFQLFGKVILTINYLN